MTEQSKQQHPSEFGLHRWNTSGHPKGEVTLHVQECELCQGRIDASEEEKKTFLKKFPVSRFQQALEQRSLEPTSAKDSSSWFSYLFMPQMSWVFAVFALGLGTILGLASMYDPDTQGNHRTIRLKGYQVDWAVRRGGQQMRVNPRFVFRNGDRLGIQVLSPIDCYATLLLVKPDGTLQQWLPQPSQAPLLVSAGKKMTLPESLQVQRPIPLQGMYLLLTPKPVNIELLQQRLSKLQKQPHRKKLRQGQRLPVNGYQESRWIALP